MGWGEHLGGLIREAERVGKEFASLGHPGLGMPLAPQPLGLQTGEQGCSQGSGRSGGGVAVNC